MYVFVTGKVEDSSKIYKNKLQLVEEQTAMVTEADSTAEPLQTDSIQVVEEEEEGNEQKE